MKKFLGILTLALGILPRAAGAEEEENTATFAAWQMPYKGFIGILDHGLANSAAGRNLCQIMESLDQYEGTQDFDLPGKCWSLRRELEERKDQLESDPNAVLQINLKKFETFSRILQQFAKSTLEFHDLTDPHKNKKPLTPETAGSRLRGRAELFSGMLDKLHAAVGLDANCVPSEHHPCEDFIHLLRPQEPLE